MGYSRNYDITQAEDARRREEYHKREREREAEAAAELQAMRKAFAEKVVSHLIDKINAAIVRPGPDPEERECYQMADELRDFRPTLVAEVVAQLNVNKGCR